MSPNPYPHAPVPPVPSDEQLTAPLRAGLPGGEEIAELYRRHRAAVRAYAGACCRDPHTAEDLTSEAFTLTLAAVRRGAGPVGPWRPYLFTVVRRTALDWAMSARRTEITDDIEACVPGLDPEPGGEELVLRREERGMVARSFAALPERWQTVLWLQVVERRPAAAIGVELGLTVSGVASLAERARDGLREAYLQVHAEGRTSPSCRRYGRLLAAAVRRVDRRGARQVLVRHLETCARCRRVLLELKTLNTGFRGASLRSMLPGALLLCGAAGARWSAVDASAASAALLLIQPAGFRPDGTERRGGRIGMLRTWWRKSAAPAPDAGRGPLCDLWFHLVRSSRPAPFDRRLSWWKTGDPAEYPALLPMLYVVARS
ncbi:RNA polymerase sigma factor [Streptomyces decoyicus]|uniref:RNA polymerase sigma factor n=1 Tax=Streptomyces decoyicus TaxID=249567 RepID=UPI0036686BBD